jgi:polyisoprenoid-binding protein YceI
VRSCLWVSGRSSLHPINTETRGITGWFEASTAADGSLDLGQPVSGELELAVERLTSGNQLYDRELRRRIDARRFPTIAGTVTRIAASGGHPRYMVSGDVSFHGKTRTFEHEMNIEAGPETVSLTGDYQFDIREFGMKPPSMLMVRVYPEISVRVELYGTREA